MDVINSDICEILDSSPQLSAIDQVLTIAQLPEKIKRHGRRYSRVFFSRQAEMCIHLDKLGDFLLSFPSGWNTIEVPDGTPISLADGQEPLVVIHRVSDNVG